MPSYLQGARSNRRTPEIEPILGREAEMVVNDAGGYAFEVGSLERLRRFLILGAEGGTYYTDQRKHVARNTNAVSQALREHGVKAVDVIVDVSVNGHAPNQDPALFALAMAASWAVDKEVAIRAWKALPRVARTGYQLFTFAGFVTEMRGFGLLFRKGIAGWYTQRDDVCPHCGRVGLLTDTVDLPGGPPRKRGVLRCSGCTGLTETRDLRGVDWLAYQMVKYRQRDGWTHKRLIDLSHPVPPTPEHESLYQFVLGMKPLLVPEKIEGFEWAQLAPTPADTVKVLRERPWLPWEALRTEHTADPDVWRALIDNGLNMGALVRNLGRLTSYEVIKSMDPYTAKVVGQLTSEQALTRSRTHPVALLKALMTYRSGSGARLSWSPVRAIVDALDEAFYKAFGAVEPSGRRTMLAIDVSGSMTQNPVAGLAGLSAREAAAAMALVTAAREPMHEIVAFSSRAPVTARHGWSSGGLAATDVYERDGQANWCIAPLDISPRMRLSDAVDVMRDCQAGATDLSMPMLYAQQKALDVDTFVIYTDNESYAGRMHPSQALRHYRQSTGIRDARLVVVAMTATAYSVADPRDAGMLDVVGFDTAAPGLISAFSRGEV